MRPVFKRQMLQEIYRCLHPVYLGNRAFNCGFCSQCKKRIKSMKSK